MEHATFQNMKFRVENEEHSRQIQEALFKLGYYWMGGKVIQYTQAPYLYASGGILTYSDACDEPYYNTTHHQEYVLDDIKMMLGAKELKEKLQDALTKSRATVVEERPPIGLRPKSVVTGLRIKEILEACTRYAEAGKEIPAEWLEELGELNGSVV